VGNDIDSILKRYYIPRIPASPADNFEKLSEVISVRLTPSQRSRLASKIKGRRARSLVISTLIEMWLDGQINVVLPSVL
jgi:hypothetical protein